MTDEAKAIEEGAKTLGKAIDAGSKLGSFFDRVFGNALVDMGDLASQWTFYWKFSNALRLRDKVYKRLTENGLDHQKFHLPPRIGIPLIEAASNEDDELLSDMWAGLLAQALTEGGPERTCRSHIEVLKQLANIDAFLLQWTFRYSYRDKGVYVVEKMPREYDIGLSLRNLERLGLIKLIENPTETSATLKYISSASDDVRYSFAFHVELTAFGFEFYTLASGDILTDQTNNQTVSLIDWEAERLEYNKNVKDGDDDSPSWSSKPMDI